jgi:hypothetical protein
MNVCRTLRSTSRARALAFVPVTFASVLLLGCGGYRDSDGPAHAGSSNGSVDGQAGGGAAPAAQAGSPGAGAPGAGGTSTEGGASTGGGTAQTEGGSPAQGGASTSAGTTSSSEGGTSAAEGGSDGEQDDFETVLATYGNWASATDEPVDVASHIWLLCRSPTATEMEFAESEHGNLRAIREWDNSLAESAISAGRAGEFATGAAIAKEKWTTQNGAKRLVAVGMMIRRANGFDPATGDWEFAYWEEGKGISRGTSQSHYCGDCHASAERGDFVFRAGYQLE